MALKCLSILGVGLLGGSIGLAVKSIANGVRVVGYGHRTSTLEEAARVGAIDLPMSSAAEAVRGADLVILCTPVGLFEDLLREIAPALTPGAVVTDVGSTKRSVVELAERILPRNVHFVGSHPMAGSEQRGVQHAAADLFHGAVCITTPSEQTNPAALKEVEGFWRLLGMHVTRLSVEEHDRRLADISHLPHAVAAALVATQDPASFPLAGKGFLDATRIAAGDAGLWRDIFIDNRDNLRDSVRRLRMQLDELLARLDAADGEAVRAWLDEAATRRKALKPGAKSLTDGPSDMMNLTDRRDG
jgi:prephenate dehydrogenase